MVEVEVEEMIPWQMPALPPPHPALLSWAGPGSTWPLAAEAAAAWPAADEQCLDNIQYSYLEYQISTAGRG